jgi:hypothetical protein
MTRVLQQEPADADAVLWNQQHAAQFKKFYRVIERLINTMKQSNTAEAAQILDAVLGQSAAHCSGTLMAWAQQRPQQLAVTGAAQGIWLFGSRLLDEILDIATTVGSSSTSTADIATTITEQLQLSGRVWLWWFLSSSSSRNYHECLTVQP